MWTESLVPSAQFFAIALIVALIIQKRVSRKGSWEMRRPHNNACLVLSQLAGEGKLPRRDKHPQISKFHEFREMRENVTDI